MNSIQPESQTLLNPIPNGPVAAALLACGFGCFALGALGVAADGSKAVAAALNFYNPCGPLSGVTTPSPSRFGSSPGPSSPTCGRARPSHW